MNKVIKTDADYEAALARIDELLDVDPPEGAAEADELDLLVLLVQNYEESQAPVWQPDPVDAIVFRMEQAGLSQRDLIPFIGTRSRVSEVLSRKRPLTLPMLRALHKGLGIPASVLLQDHEPEDLAAPEIDWSRFPVKEITKRGWVETSVRNVRAHAEEIMRTFFEPLGGPRYAVALYRRTQHTRSAREMDNFALAAWTARIAMKSRENPPTVDYEPGVVTREFMSELVRLSWSDRGPLLAIEFLRKHGVDVIVEPHLPRTHLDGAAILVETDRPVIGLTLRHDRIDNFWFCLMHELAHIALHLDKNRRDFFDDLDVEPTDDPLETEADTYAGEILIPADAWASSAASKLRSAAAAESLAKKLRIHPAIVAGRIRHEFGSYRVLNQLVGHKEVRKLFTDVSWE